MKATDISNLKEQALAETRAAVDAAGLEEVRVRYLGRKGRLPEIMKGLKDAAPGERPEIGKRANEFKHELQSLIEERKSALGGSGPSADADAFDYTLPGQWRGRGSKHPISILTERAVSIFRTMGFTVAEGPDVETPYYNFDALNTPADHPSRDPQDTFYLDDGHLLRTHTSPVQIRYMETHPPPVRIVAPGRAYRRDTPDATHSATFHQIEGLYVDEHVSMADLKGDLAYFAQQLLGADVKVRFRPHFFPFTEPSVEVDFSCHMCGGTGLSRRSAEGEPDLSRRSQDDRGEAGCRVCKESGWIEIAGAGMVDPNVFQAVRYDPERCTGYAFGMGIERIAMILFGIPDIRMLYENDARFLSQF